MPVLGSASDPALVVYSLRMPETSVVFHSAAYKYLPLLVAHPLSGHASMCFT